MARIRGKKLNVESLNRKNRGNRLLTPAFARTLRRGKPALSSVRFGPGNFALSPTLSPGDREAHSDSQSNQ